MLSDPKLTTLIFGRTAWPRCYLIAIASVTTDEETLFFGGRLWNARNGGGAYCSASAQQFGVSKILTCSMRTRVP